MAGRPREFDRAQALDTALEQFWSAGYEQTTVATLTRAMGIAPPSLYAAFGDKESLYEEAVACYVARTLEGTRRALDQPTAAAAISELLAVTAAAHTDPDSPRGCFVLSEARLAAQRSELRDLVRDRLVQGLRDGDLAGDAEVLADFLLAVMAGMSSRARDGAGAAEIRAIAEVAAQAVTPSLSASATDA